VTVKRMMLLLGAVVCISFLSTGASAVDWITDANYINHPAVKKIRKIYRQINAAESAGQLNQKSRTCHENGGVIEMRARLFRDRAGLTRKYVVSGGSDDSSVHAEYYYDASGTLRFIFGTLNAVNGTSIEKRVYFDEKGRHLHTNRREKGPGYPDDSIKAVIRDPDADFYGCR